MKKETKKSAPKRAKKPVDPRVEVARDVIELLRAKRIIAARMVYFEASLKRSILGDTVDVQKLMAGKNVNKCEVCAKGAMMVAFAMKHDKVTATLYGNSADAGTHECNAALREAFSIPQLDEIERAYEGFGGRQLWLNKYPNDGARLCAIMRRIIANGGEFSASEAP